MVSLRRAKVRGLTIQDKIEIGIITSPGIKVAMANMKEEKQLSFGSTAILISVKWNCMLEKATKSMLSLTGLTKRRLETFLSSSMAWEVTQSKSTNGILLPGQRKSLPLLYLSSSEEKSKNQMQLQSKPTTTMVTKTAMRTTMKKPLKKLRKKRNPSL